MTKTLKYTFIFILFISAGILRAQTSPVQIIDLYAIPNLTINADGTPDTSSTIKINIGFKYSDITQLDSVFYAFTDAANLIIQNGTGKFIHAGSTHTLQL